MFGVEFLIVTVHTIGIQLFVPESPSYLVLKKQYESASASVRYYHGQSANVSEVECFDAFLSTVQRIAADVATHSPRARCADEVSRPCRGDAGPEY